MTDDESNVETGAAIGIDIDARKQKRTTIPPDGYVCNVCGIAGHWIQQCSQRDTRKRKRKPSTHQYQHGVDPSPTDIENAKKMQQVAKPQCDCGIEARLKKVKRSKVTENSRAVGSYFFFCSKKKTDATKCNFAKPVEEMNNTKKAKAQANFFAKKRKGLH